MGNTPSDASFSSENIWHASYVPVHGYTHVGGGNMEGGYASFAPEYVMRSSLSVAASEFDMRTAVDAPEFTMRTSGGGGAAGGRSTAPTISLHSVVPKTKRPTFYMVDCGSDAVFALTVGRHFVNVNEISERVGNGAKIEKSSKLTNTLYLTANSIDSLETLKTDVEQLISVAKERLLSSASRHVRQLKVQDIVDCGSAAVFSLTVGSKFCETNKLCESLGDGAHINRTKEDDYKLYLTANTSETLQKLKTIVDDRIFRIKASRLVIGRTQSIVSDWVLPADAPMQKALGKGKGKRTIIIDNTNIFTLARCHKGQSDPTLRLSTREITKFFKHRSSADDVHFVVGTLPDPVKQSFQNEGYIYTSSISDIGQQILDEYRPNVSSTLVIASCSGVEDLVFAAANAGMRVELWSWASARSSSFDVLAQHFKDGRIKLLDLDPHYDRIIYNVVPRGQNTRTSIAASAAISDALRYGMAGGGGAGAGGGGARGAGETVLCSCEETDCFGTPAECPCKCHW
jgi:hypothetical protein